LFFVVEAECKVETKILNNMRINFRFVNVKPVRFDNDDGARGTLVVSVVVLWL
jgi:hypothetical protein